MKSPRGAGRSDVKGATGNKGKEKNIYEKKKREINRGITNTCLYLQPD
jgi:hypothetical protein